MLIDLEIRGITCSELPQHRGDDAPIAVRDGDVGHTLNKACDGARQIPLKGPIIRQIADGAACVSLDANIARAGDDLRTLEQTVQPNNYAFNEETPEEKPEERYYT